MQRDESLTSACTFAEFSVGDPTVVINLLTRTLIHRASIIHIRRVRLVNDQPIYVNDKYFPAHRFAHFEAAYRDQQSVTEMFRAHGINAFHRVETRIRGGFASRGDAEMLQLTPGTPVFRLNARNADSAGASIEWTQGCWLLTSVEFVFGPGE